MIFNQFAFILVFLPLILIAFYFQPLRRLRVHMLVATSFVFYGLSGVEHALSLAAGIVWVYLVARSSAIVGGKGRLMLAIVPADFFSMP